MLAAVGAENLHSCILVAEICVMDQGVLFCEEEMSPLSCGNAEVLDESPGVDEEESSSHPLVTALTDFPPRDDVVLRTVVLREQSQMPDFDSYPSTLQAHAELAQARALAVHWMLKVRSVHSFNPMTVALGVSYLDRYLSRNIPKPFKAWVIHLISVACISLAAKMEEIYVPCLQDLQVHSQIEFEAKTIQRMELVILKSLDWRMSGVTAFEYVDDLLHRLDISRRIRASMLARITELILGTLPEAEFLVFRPSAIALAALSCALDETLPLKADSYQKLLLSSLPVDQETLQRCYRLIEDVIIDPVSSVSQNSFGSNSSKSPPSPLTVIELYQTGDCSGTHVHLRKRKLELENEEKMMMKRARTPPVWDLF